MQQHREFAGYGYYRPLLGILAPAGGYLLSVAPEVRVLAERTKDVVGTTDQQLPHHCASVLGDVLFGIAASRLVGGGHQSQVGTHFAAFRETRRIFKGKYERQGGQHSYAVDLSQELGLRIDLLGYVLQAAIVLSDALGQGGNALQDRFQGRHQLSRQAVSHLLVKALRRTLGQASSEGLDHASEMIDELGSDAHQRIT